MVTTAMPVVLLGVRAPVERCCRGAASVVADGPGWPAALVPGVAAVACRPASRSDRGWPPTQPQAVGGHAKSTPSGVAAPSLAVGHRSRPIPWWLGHLDQQSPPALPDPSVAAWLSRHL